MRGSLQLLTAFLTILILGPNAFGAGLERAVFSSAGLRIFPKLGDELPDEVSFFPTRIVNPCSDDPSKTCIRWKLVTSLGIQANDVLPSIISGLNIWNQQQNLKFQFVYAGIATTQGIPYATVPGSEPAEIARDQFGNQIITGDVLISFAPPEGMFSEGMISSVVKYLVPELADERAKTQWAGIFLNPSYQPNNDYQLTRVIAAEAGRVLGLSGSAMKSSLLYPFLPPTPQMVALTEDDLIWAQALTLSDAPANLGSLSGRIVSGETGQPIVSAPVFLIPADAADAFSQTADWGFAKHQAFTDDDGIFWFKRLPPGDYVVAAGSLKDFGISTTSLDDFTAALGYPDELGIEFYDGATRESNQEAALSFSPSLIYSAATVHVVASEETSSVNFISNVADPQIERVSAEGSSNETLSQYEFRLEDRMTALRELDAETPKAAKKFGGCLIEVEARANLFGLLFALVLGVLFVVGRRRELSRFESQQF
jgi:hypothetical protein